MAAAERETPMMLGEVGGGAGGEGGGRGASPEYGEASRAARARSCWLEVAGDGEVELGGTGGLQRGETRARKHGSFSLFIEGARRRLEGGIALP